MDATEKGFLDELTKDPRNQSVRLIYADYLEDRDRPEEAQRMRLWEASYQWFEALAAEGHDHCPDGYGASGWNESGWRQLTTDQLIEAGAERANSDYPWTQIGNDSLRDAFDTDEKVAEYWHHWEIVTGGRRPTNVDNKKWWSDRPFGCSC